MKAKLYDTKGENVGTLELPKGVFEVPLRENLVHQVVVSQAGNRRTPVAHTKTRGEVSGGGKKPWRQKGTGRARHGSIRSPIWIGGGVAFGPRNERGFKRIIPRKMARRALQMVLAAKAQNGLLFVIEDPSFSEGKTKEARGIASRIPLEGKRALLILPEYDQLALRAVRNLEEMQVSYVSQLNAYEVLSYPYVILTKSAIEKLTSLFEEK